MDKIIRAMIDMGFRDIAKDGDMRDVVYRDGNIIIRVILMEDGMYRLSIRELPGRLILDGRGINGDKIIRIIRAMYNRDVSRRGG